MLAAHRQYPPHGFTPSSVFVVRAKEQSAVLTVSYNLMLPFTLEYNNRLETYIKEDREMTKEDLTRDLTESATMAVDQWGTVLFRVAFQTSVASALLAVSGEGGIDAAEAKTNSTFGGHVVYAWDSAPRLKAWRVRELFGHGMLAGVGRVVGSLLGAQARDTDMEFFSSENTASGAMYDAFCRNILYVWSEFALVVVRRVVLDVPTKAVKKAAGVTKVPPSSTTMTKRVNEAKESFTACCWKTTGVLLGAGVGRLIGGPASEYWGGECFGPLAATTIGNLLKVKKAGTGKGSPQRGAR